MRHLAAGVRAAGVLVVVTVVAACSADVAPGATLTPVPTVEAPSAGDPTPAGPADEVRVVLGIYSGRTELTAVEIAAVEQSLAGAP